MSRQAVDVHYRRLGDVTNAFNGQTLEDSVRTAMKQRVDGDLLSENWQKRAWVVPPSDEDILLINLHQDGNDFYFGDLIQYTRGFMQALLTKTKDTATIDVEQVPPPEDKEYVQSMMYWMAVKNHVLVIQSRSLTAKKLGRVNTMIPCVLMLLFWDENNHARAV